MLALLPRLGIDLEAEVVELEQVELDSAADAPDAAAAAAAAAADAAAEAAVAAAAGSGVRGQGKAFETAVILGLANLFIKTSAKLSAFRRLVPHVFSTHLLLGTPDRAELNRRLGLG